jgi:hypothetical protein
MNTFIRLGSEGMRLEFEPPSLLAKIFEDLEPIYTVHVTRPDGSTFSRDLKRHEYRIISFAVRPRKMKRRQKK